jgi:hypothetical protein
VFLAGGLRPLSELAALAGCQMIAAPELGGTIPLYGPGLETTAPGVHVAGNIVGIESATVAMAQGRLAAAAIAAPHLVEEERRNAARARREAALTFLPRMREGRRAVARAWGDVEMVPGHGGSSPYARPHPPCPPLPVRWERGEFARTEAGAISDLLLHLPDDLVVCRCEEVTVGMVRRVAGQGTRSAEEIKRFTRMTMGACQGRVCQEILERIHLAYGRAPVGQTSLPGHRPPIRPVALGELAALADGNEEWERLHGALLPSLPFDDAAGRRIGDPAG